MAVYKEEKTNTWRAVYRYTDWNGERKQTQKRGFKTKREAQAWEREQLNKSTADLDMSFKSFVEFYTADMLDVVVIPNCFGLFCNRHFGFRETHSCHRHRNSAKPCVFPLDLSILRLFAFCKVAVLCN